MMSRLLAEILEVNPQVLGEDIRHLEDASGQESIDVRLTTDILATVRQKTRELGLDPKDTTSEELYHGLMGMAKMHDEFLAKRVGGSNQDSTEQLLAKIRSAALGTKGSKTAWVIKYSVAKRLLKQMPPKKVMKYLGYKSLDSMLKREPVSELYVGMMLLESPTWYESFVKKYLELSQMDFETRAMDIICLSSKRWEKAAHDYVHQQRHIIMTIRELGVVAILPTPMQNRSGLTLALLPQLFHHLNEIRLYTSFYKLHQMQGDLGAILVASLLHDMGTHVYLAGSKVHWRVVQRHFGKDGGREHPELLEPHLQPDDLSWRKIEATLFRLEPALHFWHDTDYVAAVDRQPVSFNIMDVALNYFNQLSYEQRSYAHCQSSLWNELFVRYMGMPALENQVLKQLDYEATAPELLALTQGRH